MKRLKKVFNSLNLEEIRYIHATFAKTHYLSRNTTNPNNTSWKDHSMLMFNEWTSRAILLILLIQRLRYLWATYHTFYGLPIHISRNQLDEIGSTPCFSIITYSAENCAPSTHRGLTVLHTWQKDRLSSILFVSELFAEMNQNEQVKLKAM